MPNTLTNLIPDIYASLDVVSRELVGFIPASFRDARADRVAIGQTLRSPVVPVNTAQDIVVGMAFPTAAYQAIGNKALTITKSREVPFSWQGTETNALNSNGPGSKSIIADQFTQAMRVLCNEMEADLAVAARLGASRAYGTAATTPFATNLSDTAKLKKILDDNGAPMTGRTLVIDTAAGAAVRTLSQLTKANEAADSTLLRQGTLLDIHGFALRESAQVVTAASVGTAASATVSNAGYAAGATTLTLTAAGTGTILAGDIITIARQTDSGGALHKYVVVTGNADVSAGGTIVIAAPGLRSALTAATAAITVIAASTLNVGFTQNALLLATRLPDLPDEGDMAIDRTTITDDRSGISFEVSAYAGKRMITYTVAASWGVLATKAEHIAILLG